MKRQMFLELTGHTFLDFGILPQNALQTEHFTLWDLRLLTLR